MDFRLKKKMFAYIDFSDKKDSSVEKTSPKSPSRKKGEEDNSVQKKNHRIIINHEKPTSGPSNTTIRDDYAPNRNGTQIINSTRKFPMQNNKKMNHKEDHIKPFRQFDKTKGKMNNNFRRGKMENGFLPFNHYPLEVLEHLLTPRFIFFCFRTDKNNENEINKSGRISRSGQKHGIE